MKITTRKLWPQKSRIKHFKSNNYDSQLLQLCTACTVWSKRSLGPRVSARSGKCTSQLVILSTKILIIHRQTSYDFIVSTVNTGVKEICRLMVSNETSNDSSVLTKDTGVIWGLLIDGDQWKAENNLNKLNWPLTRCFLRTGTIWTEYRALTIFFCLSVHPTKS